MGEKQKLIFKPVMEALFIDGLGDRSTPAFKGRLAKLGVNLDKLLPGYDYAVFEAGIVEATSLFPELSREAALQELGRRMVVANIEANPVGKTLMPVLRLLGLARAIRRTLTKGSNENFNVVTFPEESPQSLDVHMSFVGQIPEFARGTLLGLATALGGKAVNVSVLKVDGSAACYRVQWAT